MDRVSIKPTVAEFLNNYNKGLSQLVWCKLVADSITPISAMLKLSEEEEPCFFLESVEGGESRGRYSIIGLKPDVIWRCYGDRAEIRHISYSDDGVGGKGGNEESDFVPCHDDSIKSLKKLIGESYLEIPEGLPPMSAGLVGYHGYDMIKLVEDIPSDNPDNIAIPDACLMRPSVSVIFDSRDGVIYVAVPIWHCNGVEKRAVEALHDDARKKIENVVRILSESQGYVDIFSPDIAIDNSPKLEFKANMSKDDYIAMVNKAKEYIAAGDIFQVVPSQRFTAEFSLPPLALYRALRYLNPSPFLFYLNLGGFTLVGSSPEILVRVRDGKITIRPIAGTRRRGRTLEEDIALEKELLSDPKELAEHLMLLDLGRNDVGRCAKTGTVSVTEQMIIERYSHVMHIVSNVEGELDSDKYSGFDALMSGFPAGTVSGAPKVRAMQIIDELEPESRSFYAGCVGYFSADGGVDTCITLRTALVKGGKIYLQAGGGVVADSDPEAEYQETINKAKALMKAAEFAVNFVD